MAMNHIHSKAQHKEQLYRSLDLHGECDDLLAVETDASLQNMLSPEDYALLHAYCIEERPHEELCRQYGLSDLSLRVRISRLRKFLFQNFIFLVTILLVAARNLCHAARALCHGIYSPKNAKNRPVYADRFFVIHAVFCAV